MLIENKSKNWALGYYMIFRAGEGKEYLKKENKKAQLVGKKEN